MKSSKGNVWAETSREQGPHGRLHPLSGHHQFFSNQSWSLYLLHAFQVTKASHQTMSLWFLTRPLEAIVLVPTGRLCSAGETERGWESQRPRVWFTGYESWPLRVVEIQWHAAFIKHQAPRLTHGCWGFKGLINNTPLRSSSAYIQLRNETLGPDQLRSGWATASLRPCWWTAGLALQSTWGAHLSASSSSHGRIEGQRTWGTMWVSRAVKLSREQWKDAQTFHSPWWAILQAPGAPLRQPPDLIMLTKCPSLSS